MVVLHFPVFHFFSFLFSVRRRVESSIKVFLIYLMDFPLFFFKKIAIFSFDTEIESERGKLHN